MAYVRTHDFEAVFCKDPKCGLHIFPYIKGDKPICEVVLSADDTLGLIEFCQKHLRQRNADRTVSDIPDNRRRYPAPAGGRPGRRRRMPNGSIRSSATTRNAASTSFPMIPMTSRSARSS
jgi:hypothetical protein